MKQFIKLTFIGLASLLAIVIGIKIAYKITRYVAERAVDMAVDAIEVRTCYNIQSWTKQSNLCQPDQETIDMCKVHNIIIK